MITYNQSIAIPEVSSKNVCIQNGKSIRIHDKMILKQFCWKLFADPNLL